MLRKPLSLAFPAKSQQISKARTDNTPRPRAHNPGAAAVLLCLQPQALLSALVNKLGDPSRKIASDAAFLLGSLLLQHPAMKAVVVREVRVWGFLEVIFGFEGFDLPETAEGVRVQAAAAAPGCDSCGGAGREAGFCFA